MVERRFKTWKFDITCDLPQQTNKVFKYNLKMKVITGPSINIKLEELEVWLVKHSAWITSLSHRVADQHDPLEQKLIKLLHGLKQVKDLEIWDRSGNGYLFLRLSDFDGENDLVKTLLSSMGPQLESLTVMLPSFGASEIVNIHLSSLKYLRIYSRKHFIFSLLEKVPDTLESLHVTSDRFESEDTEFPFPENKFKNLRKLELISNKTKFISSLLRIVPATIESLVVESRYINSDSNHIDFPRTWNQVSKLKMLEILSPNSGSYHCPRLRVPNLTPQLINSSLTSLYLNGIEMKNLSLNTDLPVLKTLHIKNCGMKMNFLKSLLMKSSQCLEELYMDKMKPVGGVNKCNLVGVDMKALTTLILVSMKDPNLVSQLISMCSRTVTILKCHFVNFSFQDQLTCELPHLKILSVKMPDVSSIDKLLSKCSSSLEVLHLTGNFDNSTITLLVNVPNLRELYIDDANIDGFTHLVSPQGSKIETLGFEHVEGSIWEDIGKCRFPSLKSVYLENAKEEQLNIIKKVVRRDVNIYRSNDADSSWPWSFDIDKPITWIKRSSPPFF